MSKSVAVKIADGAPAVVSDETTALVSMIERAARDPSVDLDKMERLFKLHEAALDRRARADFASALSMLQEKMPTVVAIGRITGEDKASGNKITRSRYAKWEDVNEAIRPALCEYGFALSFRISQPTPDRVAVTAVLSHRSGHSEETTLHLPNDPSGGKNNVQAWGSSISYGKRYTAFAMLNIASRGEDDDAMAATTGIITPEQVEEIESLAAATGVSIGWICEHHCIETLADMTAKDYAEAKSGLSARKRSKA